MEGSEAYSYRTRELTGPSSASPINCEENDLHNCTKVGGEKCLPAFVNAIALVIHKPANPASSLKVEIENTVVIRTAMAPSVS